MKKILLYGFDDLEADRFQNAAESAGLAMYVIGDTALDMTVSRLFEIDDDLDAVHSAYDDHYMLFQGFELPELIQVGKDLASAGAPFDGIRIMRTDENENWTLRRLLEEAASEHHLSRKVMILQELIRSCGGVDVKAMDEQQQREFRDALTDAFRLLQSGEFTGREIDEAIRRLSEELKSTRRLLS
ncbi:MAG: DUF3783 domain-containing protein [Solobacterium sp.]|nr:DUF3783 domain-containing protein [Solobacterium sp.]